MKKLIFNLIISCSILAFLTQCQPREKGSHAQLVKVNGNEIINCNVSQITDTVDFPLSQVVGNCELIQLETNEKSLFQSVYHIGISDNYIAIHSYGQMPIKLFDRKGKFVRNIGKVGRGPGEFNSLYGIQIDESANKVYLSPFARATKLIVYSLDDEILPEIPLVYQQTKFKAYVDNDIVTVLSMPFEGSPIPIAYQQTTDGKVIKECFEPKHLITNPRNEKGQFVGFNNELSSSHNANAFDYFKFSYGGSVPDTLYYYDAKANKMIPKFVTSFDGEYPGSWTYEWKEHYFSWIFGDKYKGSKVIVDKKTLKSDFFTLKNDFYGGIELNKFFMSNDGWFVASMPAHELKAQFTELLKSGDLKPADKEKIEPIAAQLDENDNEVIFIGEMK